jgi:tetratricopeptide (TPR) repeat protein
VIEHEDFSITFSLSNVPTIEHFIARKTELIEIHKALSGDGSHRRIVVLYGLGGIGKTQLGITYTKQYKDSYSAVFWLNSKDEDSLKQSFATVAKQILREHPSAIRLSNVDTDNLDGVVDAVKEWLGLPYNTQWLIIYDNYDNPKLTRSSNHTVMDIEHFLPESNQGSVIIITRSSQYRNGHSIQIRKLGIYDSLEILSMVSRREGIISGKNILHFCGTDLTLILDPDAIMLAKELDGLPLALTTTGAYLNQTAISLSDYLRLYKQSWVQLQESSPKLYSYIDQTLYSTWQISFDHVKQQNSLSAKLLCFWAYFDSQDLWLELLQHSDSNDPDWVQELTKDEVSFHKVVQVLNSHGLVELDTSSQDLIESRGYSIHKCVHSWTVHVLNQAWDHNLARLAFKYVGSHIPGEQTNRPWLTQRRLLRHAVRCSSFISLVTDDGMEWAYHNLGDLFVDQGRLAKAEQMYQRALKGKEKAWGSEHTSTLDTVNNLGTLYKGQGKLIEAEHMYQRALEGKKKALGSEHPSTLDTVNNLGLLYANQGKLTEAEHMYQQALQGYEKSLGPEYLSTLNTVNNLGLLYTDQGNLVEAEHMYQRALKGKKKALGSEHPSTLDTVNNLGVLYANQGKLTEAEHIYQRALQGYEKSLGPEHLSTLDTVNNLGLLYTDQGKLVEAEYMYQRALQGYEKALGPKHPSTFHVVNNLGLLYTEQGKLVEAEHMYQRALEGKKKALGSEHPSTLNTVNNLGVLYANQGKLSKAGHMYQQALQGYEKLLGPEHLSTLDTVNNLGLLYTDQGKLVEAEYMYQRALQGYEKALGPEHMSTLYTVNNLGLLYAAQGKLGEAEHMYQRALQGYEKVLGLDGITMSILALNTTLNLGSLYMLQANIAKAKVMYSKALTGYEKVLGPSHPKSQSVQGKLRAFDTITKNERLEDVVENKHDAVMELRLDKSADIDLKDDIRIENDERKIANSDSGYASGTYRPSNTVYTFAESKLAGLAEPSEAQEQVGYGCRADAPDPPKIGLYDKNTAYSLSDTPSLPPLRNRIYIDDLASQLFKTVASQKPDQETLNRVSQKLPDLLRAFSLKIGYRATPNQCHVAYFLHKNRGYVR